MHEYAQVMVYLSTPRTEAELDDLNLALGRPAFPAGITLANKQNRLRASVRRRDQHTHVPASASTFLTAHGVAPLAAPAAAVPATPPTAVAPVHAPTPVTPAPAPAVAPVAVAATPVAAPAAAAAAPAPAGTTWWQLRGLPDPDPGYRYEERRRIFRSPEIVQVANPTPATATAATARTGNDRGSFLPVLAGAAVVLCALFLALLLWVNRDNLDFGDDDDDKFVVVPGNGNDNNGNGNSSNGGANSGNANNNGRNTEAQTGNASSSNKKATITGMLDGRSENPRTVEGFVPDSDCNLYQDSGIPYDRRMTCSVPDGWTLLAFGVTVIDMNTGHAWDQGGFMAFVGPTDVDVAYSDGAVSAKPSGDQAYQDYCIRRNQHITRGWLMGNDNDPDTRILPDNWDPKCGS